MKSANKIRRDMSVKLVAAGAFLSAISIVMGKYLAIPVGELLRFSFENLPIILAGVAFGPILAILVGVVADLVGCVLVGYTINPIITVGAAVIGALSGISYKLFTRLNLPYAVRIVLSVLISHLFGSVIIKSVGLSAFYSIPLYELMLWRLLNYLIVGIAESLILFYLMKNKLLISKINSIKGEKK